MKIIRYKTRNESPSYGWIFEDLVGAINGDPFSAHRRLEAVTPISQATLLAPLQPSKIIGVRHNYHTGVQEIDDNLPETPSIFLKPPSSLIGQKQFVTIPPQTNQLTFTAELAVVIGKPTRWITMNSAYEYLYGFTCAINFYAADLVKDESASNIARAFGFDTFCPIGPWIQTELDPNDLLISASVNGKMIRMFTTHEMVFTVAQITAYLSTIMTLNPGDLILTGGVPIGSTMLKAKDTITVEIQEIGKLQVELAAFPHP